MIRPRREKRIAVKWNERAAENEVGETVWAGWFKRNAANEKMGRIANAGTLPYTNTKIMSLSGADEIAFKWFAPASKALFLSTKKDLEKLHAAKNE